LINEADIDISQKFKTPLTDEDAKNPISLPSSPL
jgi:hypothetical protein